MTTTLSIDPQDAVAVARALAMGASTYQLSARLHFSTPIGPLDVDLVHAGNLDAAGGLFGALDGPSPRPSESVWWSLQRGRAALEHVAPRFDMRIDRTHAERWCTAALGVLVSACAASGTAPSGTSDAAADGAGAEVDAAPTGPIHVKVYSELHPGEPGAGARVVFAPRGQPAEETVADADGVVDALVPEGTDVTVAQRAILVPSGEWGTIFTTFADLGPSASVVAGPRQRRPEIVSQFTVALPAYPGGGFYTLTASCELGGVADQNVLTVSVYGPCATATAATLVGRVKGEQGALLGVTVLEGVDLLAANGTTVTMPPFDVAPVTITATLTNVADITDAVTTFATYRLGDAYWMLERAGASARHGGLVQLAFPSYPVGDQTSFDVELQHIGGTVAVYHHGESGRAVDFTFDASSIIEGILGVVVGADAISWTRTEWGTAPDLVYAKLWSGDIRGVLVAPGDGSSISLDAIPPDLRRPWIADDVKLQFYAVDGFGYRDIVPLLEEPMDSGVWPRPPFTWQPLTVPRSSSYWRTAYPAEVASENGM